MGYKYENNKKISVLEIIKWSIVTLLCTIAIIGNYLYREYNPFFRGFAVFFTIFFSMYIVLTTNIGKLIIIFVQESYEELKKVVWPTCIDGLYTTFIVSIVTILMSLIFWGLDTIIVYMISYGLRI